MEVEKRAMSSRMIGSQRLGLSHPTGRKSILNQQKLTYFAIVSSDQNNTILENNTLYICKSIKFICFSYIHTTIYSSYYPSKSSYLIIDLDFALCAIVKLMSFLLYYPLYTFTHYSSTYKHFSVMSKANYNNISPDSSVSIGLLWINHLHPVSSCNYSCNWDCSNSNLSLSVYQINVIAFIWLALKYITPSILLPLATLLISVL